MMIMPPKKENKSLEGTEVKGMDATPPPSPPSLSFRIFLVFCKRL